MSLSEISIPRGSPACFETLNDTIVDTSNPLEQAACKVRDLDAVLHNASH